MQLMGDESSLSNRVPSIICLQRLSSDVFLGSVFREDAGRDAALIGSGADGREVYLLPPAAYHFAAGSKPLLSEVC